MTRFELIQRPLRRRSQRKEKAVKAASFVAAAALLMLGVAQANGQYIVRETWMGSQKTTTITPAPPAPSVVVHKDMGGPPASGVVLTACDWRCGRCFTDDCGRRWCQVCGCPVCPQPELLKGWLLPADCGRLYFLSTCGRLYIQVGLAPAGIPI
jgi:hypothetical protein